MVISGSGLVTVLKETADVYVSFGGKRDSDIIMGFFHIHSELLETF